MPPKIKTTKVYKKIGQIYPVPEKNDSSRIFYRSLHRQNKNSKMAIKWLLEHGLFSGPKAEKLYTFLQFEQMSVKEKKNN